jgi:hypothetical protein
MPEKQAQCVHFLRRLPWCVELDEPNPFAAILRPAQRIKVLVGELDDIGGYRRKVTTKK